MGKTTAQSLSVLKNAGPVPGTDRVRHSDGQLLGDILRFQQDSPHSPMIITNPGLIFRRRLHVMDFIHPSQWGFIESGNTASQDVSLVTAGLLNALRAMKDRKTELHCGYGVFKTNKLSLSGAIDCMIYGGGGAHFQHVPGQAEVLEIYGRSKSVWLDGVRFIGSSTAQGEFATEDLLNINNSAFINVERCKFTDFSRWAAVVTQMTGGTITEGAFFDDCYFEDAPAYPADTAVQAALAFGQDGEYCSVTDSKFYRVPSAARFTDGANGLFADNIVMRLNGGDGTLQTDRAAVYCEGNPASNAGKITIDRCKINHNETGLVPIICKGDPAKPQNAYEISGNDCLVNGNGVVGYQCLIYDAPRTKLTGNKWRPKSANTHGHPCVRINDSDDVDYSHNYGEDGQWHLQASNSKRVKWGSNESVTPAAGIVDLINGATLRNQNAKTYVFRISTAGVAGVPFDTGKNGDWACSRVGAGHYQITHDIGSVDYSCSFGIDNSSSPGERRFSYVRGATTLDIYVTDGAGAATDENIVGHLTLGNLNKYGL